MSLFAGFWQGREVVTVKVVLNSRETRLIDVTAGTSSCLTSGFLNFIASITLRFGVNVEPTLCYKDEDGDSITISTDGEFEAALNKGSVTRFEAVSFDRAEAGAKVDTTTTWSTDLHFWVNGEAVTVTNPDPAITLLDWLREAKVHHPPPRAWWWWCFFGGGGNRVS